MTKHIEHAIQLYNEASLADEQGNFERAEMLYMESRCIFEQSGGAHRPDAANIMKAIAFMKENLQTIPAPL
jgi:hypothetical protein